MICLFYRTKERTRKGVLMEFSRPFKSRLNTRVTRMWCPFTKGEIKSIFFLSLHFIVVVSLESKIKRMGERKKGKFKIREFTERAQKHFVWFPPSFYIYGSPLPPFLLLLKRPNILHMLYCPNSTYKLKCQS